MTKYIATYNKIIFKAKLSNRFKSTEHYYEAHHILPTSLGGSDEKFNKVLLTAREHFICHMLLYFHYRSINNVEATLSMAHAFQMMSNRMTTNSNTYAIAKKAASKAMTGTKHKQSTKDKISQALMGTVCSDSKKKAIGEKNSKTVIQYTKSGIFIREFNSANEVSKLLGFNRSNISQVCLGYRKTSNGYVWKFKI